MSRDLGTVELPNGGSLTVSAYAGPGRGKRLQFTLTQGEGGIVAYGNTDADGVAELLGWLETWLLEQGRRSAPNEVPGPRAAIDGPAPSRVQSELPALKVIPLELRDGHIVHETPASDRLEANDVSTSLEDFGRIGEERDEGFTRALELRRQGVTATVGTIGNAVREVRGTAAALGAYLRDRFGRTGLEAPELVSPLELEELTQHAARYLLAVRGLEDLLRLASSDA